MAECWRITQWVERYEVGSDGKALTDLTKPIRATPLPYVRYKVNGHKDGGGYKRLKLVAGTPAKLLSCVAVFSKLLELAADEPRDLRGWILNERDEPATVDDIMLFTGFNKSSINTALQILSDARLAWIELDDFAIDRFVPRVSANDRKSLQEEQKQKQKQRLKHKNKKGGESGGNSGGDLGDISDSVSDQPTAPRRARMKFDLAIQPIMAPKGSKQHTSDRTDLDQNIWPTIWPEGARFETAQPVFALAMVCIDGARKYSGKASKMSVFKSLLKKAGIK